MLIDSVPAIKVSPVVENEEDTIGRRRSVNFVQKSSKIIYPKEKVVC